MSGKEERELQKKLRAVERKIAKLDEEKNALNDQLMTATEAAEAQRLHDELARVTGEVGLLEEEWVEISTELEGG